MSEDDKTSNHDRPTISPNRLMQISVPPAQHRAPLYSMIFNGESEQWSVKSWISSHSNPEAEEASLNPRHLRMSWLARRGHRRQNMRSRRSSPFFLGGAPHDEFGHPHLTIQCLERDFQPGMLNFGEKALGRVCASFLWRVGILGNTKWLEPAWITTQCSRALLIYCTATVSNAEKQLAAITVNPVAFSSSMLADSSTTRFIALAAAFGHLNAWLRREGSLAIVRRTCNNNNGE